MIDKTQFGPARVPRCGRKGNDHDTAIHTAFDVFIQTISLVFQQKNLRLKWMKTRFKRKGYIHVNKCKWRMSNVLFIVVTIASAYGKSAVMSVCLHSRIRYARSQFLSFFNAVFCFKTLETWSRQCMYTQWTWDFMTWAAQFPYGSRVMRTQKERPYDIGKVEK